MGSWSESNSDPCSWVGVTCGSIIGLWLLYYGWRFDVFLSFRGEDTRHSFTDHLYAALKRAGIPTFRDDDEIGRGQDLEPEIEKAIKESKASIVVLSENYAKSRWCLNELTLILEQRKECNHFVLPVFYGVEPSDVRHQRRSFEIEGSKWTEYNVKRWKGALAKVANLTGVVATGAETESIAEIVDIVNCKLDLKLLGNAAHLTGMDIRANGLNSWLKNGQSITNIVAVCGMGGSGKTTLARYVYGLNKHNFESSSFLEEIGKHSKQPFGLLHLQKQLLTDILGENIERISGVYEGASKIEEALKRKRVLIVLDDIDENDQLAALLGVMEFHKHSKIIITTRLLDVHAWFECTSRRCQVHKLELLNDDESLELFSCHAFGSKIPMEGFKELSVDLAGYCEGNPLALKLLGSSLFPSAEDPPPPEKKLKIWTSTMKSLNSMKGDLDRKIQGVLQRSFDSLPRDSHKELFLHIAIFFVGEDEDYVVKILDRECYAEAGIMTLINRCLLTVSPSKKLMMHQLLQDMGRSIVRKESKDPAKHSRVWCSDEAYRMLAKGEGTETIEGLALDLRKLNKGTKVLSLKTGSLAKMHKLKFLQLKYVELSGSYENFPELTWFCWHGCHLKILHSSLLTSSLVAIDLSYGKLRRFEPPTVLSSLKVLNLHGCRKLRSIHHLHLLPNLETLILRDCYRLTHVCETIAGLENLALLNLTGCKKLWKVLSNQKYVNQLERLKSFCVGRAIPEQPWFSLPRSVKILVLDYCNLECNNDVLMVFCGPLLNMSLVGNLFQFLPNNIDLKMLRVLNLSYCKNLKSILCLPSTLEELYTYWCTSLKKVTFQSASFRLQKFGYKGCLKLSEIQGLIKLVSIEKFDEGELGHMKWIKRYEDRKVDLVGDDITEGRIWHIQMLFEYGIRSTYLQGVEDQNLTSEYMSSHAFVSLHVPVGPTKWRIRGLNVTTFYRLSGEDEVIGALFAKISNKTKGLTWIYNPLVYCKPKYHEEAIWLSYWPIGNILDAGDEVCVDIIVGKGLIVSGCGASLVYMDSEAEQENWKNNRNKEEVIGGDLSEFELTTGMYYLCRRDFFSLIAPSLKRLFGDTLHYTELQGWRKSHQTQQIEYHQELHRDTLHKDIVVGFFNDESEHRMIMNAVLGVRGVHFVYFDGEEQTLYVSGHFDTMAVETCVREFETTVMILRVRYVVGHFPIRIFKKAFVFGGIRCAIYYFWITHRTRNEFF